MELYNQASNVECVTTIHLQALNLHFGGLTIRMGDSTRTFGSDDARTQARFKGAVEELVNAGLLERRSKTILAVTDKGYLAADEIQVMQGQAPNNA